MFNGSAVSHILLPIPTDVNVICYSDLLQYKLYNIKDRVIRANVVYHLFLKISLQFPICFSTWSRNLLLIRNEINQRLRERKSNSITITM